MKKGKFGIALFSAAVLALILLLAIHTTPAAVTDAVPVILRAGTETVNVWAEDGETWYAFLPGNVGEAMLLPGVPGVTLGGQSLPRDSGEFDMDIPLPMEWQENGELCRGSLTLLPSGGLPALYLNTQSGSMNFIHAEKGNAERGTARLYDAEGGLSYSGTFSSLRGRGNSTWVVHDKKPYSLDLTEEADLLGMGTAKKWILLADALDPSALRNKIVYDFAAGIGMEYAPEAQWTEVYLNGEYAGLYLLCERIENDPQRLDLGADGVVLRMDRDTRIEEETDPYFFTEAGLCLQLLDGRDSAALRGGFQSMEDAILSKTGDWQSRIDLDSWVKQYLMEEVFTSYDAGFQSQYFYCYEPSGKIYAGPVWDYDSSLGNPTLWALQSPRGLFAWRPEAMEGYATPWYHSLYGKDAFRQELTKQYRDIFLPQLEILLEASINQYAEQIDSAFARNQIRWTVESEGIQAEAAQIADYLRQRMEFLSELWLEEKEFRIVRLRDDGSFYIYYAVEPGSCLKDLPHMEDEDYPVWYRVDNGEEFDLGTPIWDDVCLDTDPGSAAPEEDSPPDLKDVILQVYHYVPFVVLLLMGLVTVLVALWKSRSRKNRKAKTKV